MTTTVKVLDQVLLVQLEPHIWSARKKLQNEDLTRVQSSDLPPSDLASLGSKKIIDTEKLKVFDRLKKRAHRACEASGVRFLGGYAISLTKVPEVAKELDKIETEWANAKADFLANYQAYVDDWLAAHPTWAHCIKGSITAKGYVEEAIGFTWQAIHVKEPKGKNAALLNRGMSRQVNGLSDQLFKEIAASAAEMLDKTLLGKDKVSQHSLQRVRQLRDKLHDLCFLNPAAKPLVDSIDFTLTLLPSTGVIEGIAFDALFQLVSLMANPEHAKQHGQLILDGMSVPDAVSAYVMKNTQVTQQPVTSGSTPSTPHMPAPQENVFDSPLTESPVVTQESAPVPTAEPQAIQPPSVKPVMPVEQEDVALCLF